MNTNRLEHVCEAVLKRLKENRSIRDEQIRLLIDEISLRIEDANCDHLPDAWHQLQQHLQKIWQYGLADQLPAEDAVNVGALWAVCHMAETVRNRPKERLTLSEAAVRHSKHLLFFQTIQQNPGIRHGVLAKRCQKSASELSQLVTRLQWDRYFSFSKAGREKYYYLEPKGTELLREMLINERKAKLTWHLNRISAKQSEVVLKKYKPDDWKDSVAAAMEIADLIQNELNIPGIKTQAITAKRYSNYLMKKYEQDDTVQKKEEKLKCNPNLHTRKVLI